jgi:hypothetical protein
MKITECIKSAYPTQDTEWSDFAASVAAAIIERALSMPTNELRAFIAGTSAGKDVANVSDNTLSGAQAMVKQALL